jgi:hypothetical protein
MIKIKLDKGWLKARRLMRNYPQRLAFARNQLIYEIAKQFLVNLKEAIPSGSEFKDYAESLRVVQVTGATGGVVNAVISDRTGIKLDDLKKKRTEEYILVYVEPKPTAVDKDLPALIALNNPWPVDLIPDGLSERDVEMIHRGVTRGEYEFVRKNTREFLSLYHADLQRVRANLSSEKSEDEEVESMVSLPDFMWQGLRTEFGINVSSKPHWRPALQKTVKVVSELVKKEAIDRSLYDPEFRGHLGSVKIENPIPVNKYVKEAGVFEEKISSMVRLDPK